MAVKIKKIKFRKLQTTIRMKHQIQKMIIPENIVQSKDVVVQKNEKFSTMFAQKKFVIFQWNDHHI
jgi:hypothetical protein